MSAGAVTTPIADITGLLFWFIFLFLLLSPTLNYTRMRNARLSVIRYFEEKYRMRLITLIHRQEKVAIFGVPVYRFIDIEDSEAVIRAIRNTPKNMVIALIIHTPGGLALAATQIAMALKKHPAKKIVVIPHYAMSGGTLISLAADEIWMDPNAVLGPVDPQLTIQQYGALPAPSIVKAAEIKGDKASDETLILADVARKAVKGMQDTVYNLLVDKMGEEKARELARIFTEGKWTHDHPITVDEAEKLGLPVKTEVPNEVYTLMELYPAPMMQRSGVEYIPRTAPVSSKK